ncbi:MAG: DUF3990 domain-containing protein [Bacteroidaceae bacterium]|nr:DUF3990 domain-containing protein [Bacteroidaceae bacterium]
MTLYHGSNVFIEKIDLTRSHPDKDFGKGYYLTDIRTQAEAMSIRRVRIAGEGEPTLTVYSFDESQLHSPELRVKVFDEPTEEWALFVLSNREASLTGYTHDYDIVIGPIADDGVAFQLDRYTRHMITLATLVEELTYRKLNRQYYFGTERALQTLIRQ